MRKVMVIGGAMTKFGKHFNRNLKSLAAEAVGQALKDAGIVKEQIDGAWVGNASQGVLTGQESIRGQVVLRDMGIGRIPVVNVENACASSATALYGSRALIALGELEVALVLGMEKMYFEDRSKALAAFIGCSDVEDLPRLKKIMDEKQAVVDQSIIGVSGKKKSKERSVFMDFYASLILDHMEKYQSTQKQLAAISSKNHFHSTFNPLAQYQKAMSVEEILAAPEVVWPLTTPMCSPIGDGAAAMIVSSEEFVRKKGIKNAVEVAACMIGSGEDNEHYDNGTTLSRLAKAAYERAGIGPDDIDVAEVHDATAYGELYATEELGFCPRGQGGLFAESGHTRLGGTIPVNVSGGLESQGHPIGATGVRQIVELYWHLVHRAGKRQVGNAKVGLAQNTGGTIGGNSEGALSITILKK